MHIAHDSYHKIAKKDEDNSIARIDTKGEQTIPDEQTQKRGTNHFASASFRAIFGFFTYSKETFFTHDFEREMVFSWLCYDRIEGVASRRSVRKLATNRSISKDDSRSGKNGECRSGKPGYSKYLCFAILHSSSSKYQTINVNWTRPRVAAFFLLLNHRPYSSFSVCSLAQATNHERATWRGEKTEEKDEQRDEKSGNSVANINSLPTTVSRRSMACPFSWYS